MKGQSGTWEGAMAYDVRRRREREQRALATFRLFQLPELDDFTRRNSELSQEVGERGKGDCSSEGILP